MVNGKIALIKEAFKSLFKCVTTRYPMGPPTHVPPGLRGLPQFDEEKCIGCGACFSSCSSKAITMLNDGDKRIIQVYYMRCIFCGRCEEICPEEGIKLSDKFELATLDGDKAFVTVSFDLVKCERCGTLITTTRQMEKVKERILEEIDPNVKETVERDLEKYMTLCPKCRRILSYELNTNTRKFYLRWWEK